MKKVFDKFWFSQHQNKLLWLANSWIGKHIFQFKKMGHDLNGLITKITPSSVQEFIRIENGEFIYKEHFFNRNEYARKLYFILMPIWYVMHFWDWIFADRFSPQLSFGFSTLTVSPDVGHTSTTTDDAPLYSNPGDSWATTRGAITGTAIGGGLDTAAYYIGHALKSGADFAISRYIGTFDTSSIPDTDTISAAVLSFAGTGSAVSNADSAGVDIVSATPALNSIIVVADYDQIGSTVFATKTLASINTTDTTYNDWTLDANGIANISKTGISKFATRSTLDTSNTTPTGINRFLTYYADNGSSKPKLVVTYSSIVGPANLKTYNTNATANIKTIDTNPMANVKSLNTNV